MELRETKTLANLQGPSLNNNSSVSNYYDSRKNILELINKTLTALKNLRTMFEIK